MLSFGALFGDLIGSFVKRRFGVKRGSDLLMLDSLSFVVFALLFASLVKGFDLTTIVVLIIATPLIHRATNSIAHYLKLKEVPW